jgi:large subunit ribosomal protein L21
MRFAIVKTGGKQYKVRENDLVRVEKIEGEVDSSIELDDIIGFMDGTTLQVGTPRIEGHTVKAVIVSQFRDKKVIIFKKKRRQNYRRKKGHRQHLTLLRITSIS